MNTFLKIFVAARQTLRGLTFEHLVDVVFIIVNSLRVIEVRVAGPAALCDVDDWIVVVLFDPDQNVPDTPGIHFQPVLWCTG